MHLGTIGFTHTQQGYNIKCDHVKDTFLKQIETFGIKIIQKHYKNFNSNAIPTIQRNPHLVCTKTNGNPYLFYLTKYNDVNQCIFIDKKIQHGYFYPRMNIINAWFDDDLFDNTIIDGEMVTDKNNNWIYIANDIIVKNNVLLNDTNLIKRLQILIDIFENKYSHDEAIAFCSFQVKKYFQYDEIPTLMNDFIPKLPYSVRGLLFKSLHLKFKDYLMNFDDNLIKNVKREKYKQNVKFLTSIDCEVPKEKAINEENKPIKNDVTVIKLNEGERQFYCKKTSMPDVYELFDGKEEKYIACVPSLAISKMLREVMSNFNVVDKISVICTWNGKFKKWMPVRIA